MKLILLYGIFFFSGMSSLIAEITWNRLLVLVIGNTVMATSFLLVAFMGGLGLGSYWGSRYFSRRTRSLLPYCILEVCIGLYVVASPLFFQPVSGLFSSIAPYFSESAILYFVRFAVSFICLFFPAFMMGATFPAIISGSALKDSSKSAARTGYLYGVNTLGAAIGCLGAGYLLLPRIGAQFSLMTAFLFNLVAASGAFILEFQISDSRSQIDDEKKLEKIQISETRNLESGIWNLKFEKFSFLHLIAAATFFIGFIALAYEVLLTRLVILFFGNQLLVFTLVLTAFLIGTGVSAMLGSAIYRYIKNMGLLFGTILFITGVLIVIPPFLFNSLSSMESDWVIQNQTILVGLIMLIPVFFLGSLLPIAIRIFSNQGSEGRGQKAEDRGQKTEVRGQGAEDRGQKTEDRGQQSIVSNAGKLYALNTFGGMLGAGVTNYFLVPLIGTQGVFGIFSVILFALALAVLWFLNKSLLQKTLATAGIVVLSIYIFSLPQKLEKLYTTKLAMVSGGEIQPELRLHYEGRVATISIIDFPWLGFRDMFLNGVEEASTRFGHVQLFKLLGILPVFVHESDSPKEALMIAFGAGIAAGAALDSEQLSSLDVVDLNPDVDKINEYFKEINGDVYNDPRFNFIAEDGRNYLLMNPKKYDLIITDSTHPRAYDSWILYTDEFYRDVKDHLLPNGVFAQWIPLSDFSLELYKIMMNTFIDVFPNVTLWNIYGTDQAFLLATPEPFRLDMKRLQKQLDNAAESLLLKKYQMDKAVDTTGFFVMDREEIEEFIGDENRVNTDNLPYNQKYSLKKHTPLRTRSFDQYQSSILPYLDNASQADLDAVEKRQVVAKSMYRYFFFSDRIALDEAFELSPEDGNVMHYINLEQQTARMTAEKLRLKEGEIREKIERLKKKVESSPGSGKSYVELAKIYLDIGLLDSAIPLLKSALKSSPNSVKAHELMGVAQANKKNWREAEKMFKFALLRDPDDNFIRDSLVRVYAAQNQHEKAVNLLLKKIKSEKKTELDALGSYQDDLNIAGSYFSMRDYKNAEKYLLESIKKYPGNTLALFYLAHLYKETNRIEDGVAQLKRILQINPYHSQAKQALKDFEG